jgi:hypothetical protein
VSIAVEILAPDGRVVATVTLPRREMFWSDGTFAPGVAYAAYADYFRDLQTASRRFEAASGEDEAAALAALAELWSELNHLPIRERGGLGRLADVGLLLDGERARLRCYWPEADTSLSDAQLDQLEALTAADDGELAVAARRFMPQLIAEVRRGRGS